MDIAEARTLGPQLADLVTLIDRLNTLIPTLDQLITESQAGGWKMTTCQVTAQASGASQPEGTVIDLLQGQPASSSITTISLQQARANCQTMLDQANGALAAI